jgi:hypothetical protein
MSEQPSFEENEVLAAAAIRLAISYPGRNTAFLARFFEHTAIRKEEDRDWSTNEILAEYERRGTPVHGKDPRLLRLSPR